MPSDRWSGWSAMVAPNSGEPVTGPAHGGPPPGDNGRPHLRGLKLMMCCTRAVRQMTFVKA
jgi:hypothetical protein